MGTTHQPEGYLALPPQRQAGGQGRPVLVLHPWWGLNETIRAFCRRLAAEGFTVFAPDLYHGEVTDTIAGAEALSNALDNERAKADVAAAGQFMCEHDSVGAGLAVIGFSLGAYFALDYSTSDPEHVRQVVLFYGTGPGDFSRAQAAYLGHFAGADPYEPAEYVDALEAELRELGRPVTFYRYPDTGHWFFEPDRVDAYNAAAAELAWERTLAFLQQAGA